MIYFYLFYCSYDSINNTIARVNRSELYEGEGGVAEKPDIKIFDTTLQRFLKSNGNVLGFTQIPDITIKQVSEEEKTSKDQNFNKPPDVIKPPTANEPPDKKTGRTSKAVKSSANSKIHYNILQLITSSLLLYYRYFAKSADKSQISFHISFQRINRK